MTLTCQNPRRLATWIGRFRLKGIGNRREARLHAPDHHRLSRITEYSCKRSGRVRLRNKIMNLETRRFIGQYRASPAYMENVLQSMIPETMLSCQRAAFHQMVTFNISRR